MHRVSSRVYRETAFTNIIFLYNRLELLCDYFFNGNMFLQNKYTSRDLKKELH